MTSRIHDLPRRGTLLRSVLSLAGVLLATGAIHAQSSIPGTTLTEAGAPPFSSVGLETLGLSAPPTSLSLLPDGRLAVTAPRQIAIGDGVRWQLFAQAPGDPLEGGLNPVVSSDGQIFLSTAEGPARVVFGEQGTWRLVRTAAWEESQSGIAPLPEAMVIDLGSRWIWHSLTGPVVAWQPGTAPELLTTLDVFEHAFVLDGDLYVSERYRGRLVRIRPGSNETILQSSSLAAITCSAPLTGGGMLVGTYGMGLQVFDGSRLRAFPASGPLATGARIQDIGAINGGYFAVAIDNEGIVFVTEAGRIVQTLDRTIDSRLSRVKRLLCTDDGAVWVLLDSGLLRISFPNPISNFEPYVGPGVTTVHPRRIDGALWLLADGRIYRASYDEDGRMSGFALDSPPQVFVNSFSDAPGVLVAGTEQGAWWREKDGEAWTRFSDAVDNLHILSAEPVGGRWLYAAHGEVGWLVRDAAGPRIDERIPAPGLTNVFNLPLRDDRGRIWLELGTGRLARVRLDAANRPEVAVLGNDDGVTSNWPQSFLFGGDLRIDLGGAVRRFDEATQRVVPDPEFLARLPGLRQVFGRSPTGPDGRLWISADGLLHVFEQRDGGWRESAPKVHPGFQPYYFTFQDDGVVWMHAQHRFARYDPRMVAPPPREPVAMITHVMVSGKNRHFVDPAGELPPLGSAENSLVVHFTARCDNFGSAPTFDVRLEGTGGDWVSVGSSGAAVFNDLKAGHYTIRVAPVADGRRGAPASLAFTIHPPWYRTPEAYLAGLLALAGLVTLIARTWSFVARRERHRLERLVAERTSDLRGSEERYRRLSRELEQRVEARTRELNRSNERLNETNRELEAFSYSVSHDLRAPLRGIDGWSHALLDDYGTTLDETARGYVMRVRSEAQRLGRLIDDLLALSRTTRAEFRPADVDLSALARQLGRRVAELRPEARVEFVCEPDLRTRGDPVLLEAALGNLLDNAWKFTSRIAHPRVEFGRTETERGPAFYVRDNGAGFDMRYSGKLFGVFQRMHAQEEFPGTGVGLATVQRIVQRHGGQVWAVSAPDQGATFYFTLPPEPGGAPAP